MCLTPCLVNILEFWYHRCNMNIKKDGLDNFMFVKLHDLMAIICSLSHFTALLKKYFYLLIMLKQKQTC